MKTAGQVHLYTGDGKGKTTAAVGFGVRAAGAGLRVLFVQFMKARASSELKPLEHLGVAVFRKEKINKFVRDMTDEEKAVCREAQMENLAYAESSAPEYDLVIMDEVISAVTSGMVDLGSLLAFLEAKPGGADIVLTGRNAPEAVRELADYISDIQAIKHPYARGIGARKGVEF